MEVTMTFGERLEKTFESGLEKSRELFDRARETAKDLSEIGILKYEIRQLESQAEKLFGRLGTTVFDMIQEKQVDSINPEAPEIKGLVNEINDVKNRIEEKEKKVEGYKDK